MYSVDDIFARLQKGEDANAIAQEMADALNDALDRKHAEDEAAANVQKEKAADADYVATVLNEFLTKYYPGEGQELTGEMIIAACDEVEDALIHLSDLTDRIEAMFTPKQTECSKSKDKRDHVSADEAIKHFLRAFGL